MKYFEKKFAPYTPDYVLDEIDYYLKKISSIKSDIFNLDNAISLVNLAVVSSRISKEQGEVIRNQIQNIRNN